MARKRPAGLQDLWEETFEAGVEFCREGDPASGEAKLREAQSLAERIRRESLDPMPLGATLNSLAAALADLGRIAEAAETGKSAFAILETVLPATEYDLAGAASNVGMFLSALESAEAGEWFEKALELMKSSVEPDDPRVARTLIAAAGVAAANDEPEEEIRERLDRAMEIALLDDAGDDLGEIGLGIARIHTAREDFAEAQAVLDKVFEAQRKVYSASYKRTMKENPMWILDYRLARAVVLRKEYRRGVEPDQMLFVRVASARLLNLLEEHDRALEHLEAIERQIELHRNPPSEPEEEDDDDEGIDEAAEAFAEALLGEDDDEEDEDEDDEDFEDDDEDEDFEEDDEEDFEDDEDEDGEEFDDEEGEESDEDDDDPCAEWRGLDPANLAAEFALALLAVGARAKDRAMLERARAKCLESLALAGDGYGDPESMEETRGLLGDIDGELKRL